MLREGIDEANAAAMTAFLNLCGQAAKPACAFSAGTPAATRAKWNTLRCSDAPDPRNPSVYPAAAKLAYARSGGFGVAEVSADEPCAQWPRNGAADRYTGPWNRHTAHTILLVGITGDSQLPYRDDLAMAHDLGRARLLTVSGYGHTEIANPSTCATNYEISYLQTGALPPPAPPASKTRPHSPRIRAPAAIRDSRGKRVSGLPTDSTVAFLVLLERHQKGHGAAGRFGDGPASNTHRSAMQRRSAPGTGLPLLAGCHRDSEIVIDHRQRPKHVRRPAAPLMLTARSGRPAARARPWRYSRP